MHLYLLKRRWDEPTYDANNGFVIRAMSEEQARHFASEQARDEGPVWTDPELATCEVLTERGQLGVILTDFNAG